MKRRTVTIKYDELSYIPRAIEVFEDESDELYDKLKKRKDIRNLRRI